MARIPYGLLAILALTLAGAVINLRFVLAIVALIVVFVGIVEFRQTGARMAVLGLGLVMVLAVVFFHTNPVVAASAAVYGLLRSFGITISVLATMLLTFLMKEVGALHRISVALKHVAPTMEQQALFLGVGFASFATSLGVVTPSVFPPLLIAMGFSPFAAITISLLGHGPITNYALLAVPISLPADIFKLDIFQFTYKINIFLPLVGILSAVGLVWILGGRHSIRKSLKPALFGGLSLGLSALLFGLLRVPVMVIGVLSGLVSMVVIYLCQPAASKPVVNSDPIDRRSTVIALSPWLILIVLAAIVSVPEFTVFLRQLDAPVMWILGQPVDLDLFAQVYTWIFVATVASLPILKPNREQVRKTIGLWGRRVWAPFVASSFSFAIAYVMAWSAMDISKEVLVRAPDFAAVNMNNVVGLTLAAVFGSMFPFVAPWLGLFGAVVGGSEASSNVMFFPIQHKAAEGLGLTDAGQNSSAFMTIYGSHANGGSIATPITPSKINNAAATIGYGGKLESEVLRGLAIVVVVTTFIVGILTGLLVFLGI